MRKKLYIISSIIMLFIAIPMLLWCLFLINNASLDYDYAGLGCFIVAIIYIFSIITAICGIVFRNNTNFYFLCQTLGLLQLSGEIVMAFLLHTYAILTLPPLIIITILYLLSAKKKKG